MYRVILWVVAALLVATAILPATADDRSVCARGAGDESIGACSRQFAINPNSAASSGHEQTTAVYDELIGSTRVYLAGDNVALTGVEGEG